MCRLAVAVLAAVAGCSDDGPAADPYACMAAGGAACFELPTDVVGAADADGVSVLPALDCGALDETSGDVAFDVTTVDFVDREAPIGDIRVEGFSDLAMTSLLFDEVTSPTGAFATSVVAYPSVSFVRTSRAGHVPVEHVYVRTNTARTAQSVRYATATRPQLDALLMTVGDRFLPDRTQLFATARDCAGNRLTNVIANVAPASARAGSRRFEPGVRVYYGDDLGTLRRRTERMQSAASGAVAITNIAVGTHYVQLWGYVTEDDLAFGSSKLSLLAELQLFVPDADNAMVVDLHGGIN